MARNRIEPIKMQPESSDEEEGSSEEESGSEESDAETEQPQMQKLTPARPRQTPPPPQSKEPSSSSGEEESGSDTESESDPQASKVKPVEEKQKASNGASKARTKAIAPVPATPTKSAAAKRPAEDASAKDAKKSRKADEPETSEKKSNLFQRLWSEEDEIVILEGMIDYTARKKSDPVSDLSAFLDYIKQNLHIDVTRTQLQDKIRRLKKKYENNKSKEKEGEQKTFSKPHELKCYDLSKRIWEKGNEAIKEHGSSKANSRVARKPDNKKAEESEEAEDVQSERRLKSDSVGANVEERMLIAGQKRLEGKEEWGKLKEKELELYLMQLEVKVAQTKLVLDAMKGRDH